MYIQCQNIQGHPSRKYAGHKLKYVQEESKKTDVRIVLETGCNADNELRTGDDSIIIGRENKMKKAENSQYQHVGAGTAIITKRGLKMKQTRGEFNNDKLISMII